MRGLSPDDRDQAVNIFYMEGKSSLLSAFTGWLAWGRRSRANRVTFVLSVSLAFLVTAVFLWATLYPDPGNFTRYLALYWAWGLCAIALIFGMAEYKTSPLRKGKERGSLFILLYIGALLIVTRILNMLLYSL